MRIILACIFLLYMVGNLNSQTQIEFNPASETSYPFINSYSSSEGFKQYYLEDSKWVRNASIPDFKDSGKFKDLALQYIAGDTIIPPQLFAYSKNTGDFSFYYLSEGNWLWNKNIPAGRIGVGSKDITSEFTPAVPGRSSYIFSYSSDGSDLEFLEATEDGWKNIDVIPGTLPKN